MNTLELSTETPHVLEIILSRPEVRNAFDGELIEEMTQVFQNEACAPEVRVIVLRGKGKIFCAGGDLNWMKRSADLSRDENYQETCQLTEMFRIMNECPKPVLGAIQGAAIGGGVGLVSVCDIALATETTIFSMSEVRLGLIPACVGPFVVNKIGPSFTRELFLSAERFKGEKALRVGLVHRVCTDEVALEKELQVIISNILNCGPQAVKAAKTLIHHLSWPEGGDPYTYASGMLADLRVSEEGQEGVKAFLEKRDPNWIETTKL